MPLIKLLLLLVFRCDHKSQCIGSLMSVVVYVNFTKHGVAENTPSLDIWKNVMFLLGISENKATRKEFAIYRSNVVVPTGPGFFSLKTFCFAKMTSRVFNIVLEGSFQRSCYEPGSTMLKKRDVIEAKLKV